MDGGINQLAATVPCANVDSECITMARRHAVVQAFQFKLFSLTQNLIHMEKHRTKKWQLSGINIYI